MNKMTKKILTASSALLMLVGAGAGMSSLSTNAHAERIYEHVAAKSLHGNRGLWLRYGSNVHIKGLLPGAYKVTIPGHRGEWIVPDLHDGAKQSRSYIRSLNFGHHHKRHTRKHSHKRTKKHHTRKHSCKAKRTHRHHR